MEKDNRAWEEIIELRMSALHLLAVHGNVCLGLRHPTNTGFNRKLAMVFLGYAEQKLKSAGLINDEDIENIHKVEQEESPHGF